MQLYHLTSLFWIQDTGAGEGEPTVPKETLVESLMEARREVQWAKLAAGHNPQEIPIPNCVWDGPTNSNSKKTTGGTCAIQYGRRTFQVRIPMLLRRIESFILAKPAALGALQVDLAHAPSAKDVGITSRSRLPALSADDPFLVARIKLFAALCGVDGQGVVETANLLDLRNEILAYAHEYVRIMRDAERDVAREAQLWEDRVGLAAIDTVRVTLPGLSEQASVAILLTPTHPLRLLWSLQLALLGESWLREAYRRGGGETLTTELRQALQGGLQPVNLPPVLFDARRIGYLQAGSVAASWDIYLLAGVADKSAALSRLIRALSGASGRGRTTTGGLKPQELHDRILRYLRQHPYVEQLHLNVFNAGDGTLITDLLTGLDRAYPDLRYQVRLFSHDAVRSDLGAALDRLVNPEATVGESAEKYSQGSAYPLHPTLSYSKNRISDFLEKPEAFQAHLSILIDVFQPRVDVAAPFASSSRDTLYGLVQDESVRLLGERGSFAWERQVVAGPGHELADDAGEAALLGDVLGAMQGFIAALGASPTERKDGLPTVRLDLSVSNQNLLYEVHRISDWVVTVDRHLAVCRRERNDGLHDRGVTVQVGRRGRVHA